MKRSINVNSHHEGDALVRVLDISALKTVQIITGLLLDLPDEYMRGGVMQVVTSSLRLAAAQRARDNGEPHEDQQALPLGATPVMTTPAGSSGD